MSLTFLLPLLCSTNIQCGYFYKRHYKNIHGSADIFAELTEHELETGELLLDFPKPATSVVAIPDGYVRMQGWTLTEKILFQFGYRLYGNKWVEIAKIIQTR